MINVIHLKSMLKKLFLLIAGIFIGVSCQKATSSATPSQGITGTVLWLEGNQMPSIGQSKANKAIPISCTVYLCKPIKMNALSGNMPLFDELPKELIIASATTDRKGSFTIEAPAGSYSVLTSTPNRKYFANRSNGQGELMPITVQAGQLSEIEVKMDYLAVY